MYLATSLDLPAPQITEKQLYEAEKQFATYEKIINAMDEEVG